MIPSSGARRRLCKGPERFRAWHLALRPRLGCDRPMELEIWQWGLLGVAVLLIVVFVVMKTKKK
jgi:hypothetical protein